MEEMFAAHAAIYEGDYHCYIRNNENDPDRPVHYHDFYEVSINFGASGTFITGSQEYKIERGDIIFTNMFEPHVLRYNRGTNYKRYLVNINPSMLLSFGTQKSNLLNIFSPHNRNYPLFHANEQQLARYENVLDAYFQLHPTVGQDLFEQALLYQLLALLYADCYDGNHVDSLASRHEAVVAQLLDYIRENLAGDLSLATLAKVVNYNEYYICKIFKGVTHYTLNNYITEKRIDRAMSNLAAGASPKAACELSGFYNYSNFYKSFRKYAGMNPQEYVRALANPAET